MKQAQVTDSRFYSVNALAFAQLTGQSQGSREMQVLSHCQRSHHNIFLKKNNKRQKNGNLTFHKAFFSVRLCTQQIFLTSGIIFSSSIYHKLFLHHHLTQALFTHHHPPIHICRTGYTFFFYKNVVFPAQAEYSYFSADFRLKIFLYYS